MNARMNLCAALLPCCLSLTTYAAEAVVDERFDCLIEPMVTIEVGSPSQGVIQSVAVDRGVREGGLFGRSKIGDFDPEKGRALLQGSSTRIKWHGHTW